MALSGQDRIDINDLINLHGHLTDAGELDQAGELFTPDVTYDLDDFGLGSLHGTAVMREAALALGEANPVGHHVTNIVITRIDDRSARVQSKGIGIKADGTAGQCRLRRHRHAPTRRLEDQLPQGDCQASGTRRARSWCA